VLLLLSVAVALAEPVRVVEVGWSFVSVFALDAGEGVVLVDTHYPGKESRLLRRFAREGIAADRFSLVVLTHGHADHAGSAAALRERLDVPVAAGAGDEGMLASGEMGELHFTGSAGRLASVLIKRHFPPLVPDRVVAERLDLSPYGVRGEVRHVGGHTPGSLVVTLPDEGVVLVGDLVRSRLLRHHRPQLHFVHDDVERAHRVLDDLLEEGFTSFVPSHGGALDAQQLATWLEAGRVRAEERLARREGRDATSR
jgi:hydroxyacylglutathione hydrolase